MMINKQMMRYFEYHYTDQPIVQLYVQNQFCLGKHIQDQNLYNLIITCLYHLMIHYYKVKNRVYMSKKV